MTDWRTVVREVNAHDEEDRLSAQQTEEMRRAVLAAASTAVPESAGWSWMRPLVVAATVIAMIAGGVAVGLRFNLLMPAENSVSQPGDPSAMAQAPVATTPNRQLQFLTPGGTRIIWVFNSELDLKATMR
jgi:hypothetical protein